MAKIPTQQPPEFAELSKQLTVLEMRAKIAEVHSRISEAQAKNREAHVRIKKAEKELAGLN